MESDRGEWGFKALKQIIKVHYKSGRPVKMMDAYRQLLSYTASSAITKNAAEKKINSILDYVSQSTDASLLQEFYSLTLEALARGNNERLWFKTTAKLANLWVSLEVWDKAAVVLQELHAACQDPETKQDDLKKGTQLLEVYALQIQVSTAQKDTKRLREIYKKALEIKSAVPHPRVLGTILECGGKMNMEERNWEQAATDFFEAFKAFDEAGSPRRVQCLKYLVLANMLMESSVDPFESQETRPYRTDPEVSAMTDLVSAYQSTNVSEFENVLRTRQTAITSDPFISNYVSDLREKVRNAVVLQVVKPYLRVKLAHIASKLGIPVGEAQNLVAGLILDGRLQGKIDQMKGMIELEQNQQNSEDERCVALTSWAQHLQQVNQQIVSRLIAL